MQQDLSRAVAVLFSGLVTEQGICKQAGKPHSQAHGETKGLQRTGLAYTTTLFVWLHVQP